MLRRAVDEKLPRLETLAPRREQLELVHAFDVPPLPSPPAEPRRQRQRLAREPVSNRQAEVARLQFRQRLTDWFDGNQKKWSRRAFAQSPMRKPPPESQR